MRIVRRKVHRNDEYLCRGPISQIALRTRVSVTSPLYTSQRDPLNLFRGVRITPGIFSRRSSHRILGTSCYSVHSRTPDGYYVAALCSRRVQRCAPKIIGLLIADLSFPITAKSRDDSEGENRRILPCELDVECCCGCGVKAATICNFFFSHNRAFRLFD